MWVWQFQHYFEYFISLFFREFISYSFETHMHSKKNLPNNLLILCYFFCVFNDLWSYCSCNVHILFWWDMQCKKCFCIPPPFPHKGSPWWKGRTTLFKAAGLASKGPFSVCCVHQITREKVWGDGLLEQWAVHVFFNQTLLPGFPNAFIRKDLGQRTVIWQRDNRRRQQAS